MSKDDTGFYENMKQKIMTEFRLEDLVFESEYYPSFAPKKSIEVQFEYMEQFMSVIGQLTDAMMPTIAVEDGMDAPYLMKIIGVLKHSNVEALALLKCFSYTPKEWIQIVKVIGASGITVLDLSSNDLQDSF